jgi:ABC-type nitrate/sulfonate/bicarbonate transport system substrate-binding protein
VTPFWVALQKGFFKEEGLDAELIQVNPCLGAIAVLNDDLDFTTTFGSTLKIIALGDSPSGLAVTSRMLQENPQLIKRTLHAMLKAQRFVFENKRETLQIMMRWLEQSPEVAEHSYELAGISLSRDGEITDQDWEKLIEKNRPLDEVRDFRLLREAQKELKITPKLQ